MQAPWALMNVGSELKLRPRLLIGDQIVLEAAWVNFCSHIVYCEEHQATAITYIFRSMLLLEEAISKLSAMRYMIYW
jgi:hypothetical protein